MISIKGLPAFFRIIIPIIFSLLSVSVNAQQMNWAFSSGGIDNDNSVVTHVDNSGDVYIGGGFTGTTDFDPSVAVSNHTSAGSTDIFLAKYNAAGKYLWSFRIGGSGKDVIAAISTDANGNVYITGYFRGSNVDFDPSGASFNLSSNGDAGVDPGYGGDIFVAKYTSSGLFVWAFNIGGSQLYDSGVAIDVDPSSNVYVGGYFRNTVDFDPSAASANLNSSSGTVFLAKYNSAGQYQWAFNLGLGDADNTMFDLKVDQSGNVYTTGFFQGTNRDFDPSPAATAFLSSNGSLEIYVAKYTTNGEYQFAFSVGGNGVDIGRGVEVDNSGNIYVIGDFHGSNVDFDPGPGTALLSSSGGADIFLAKYNNSGQYVWAFSFGGPDDDLGWKVSTDNAHLFITGGFTGTTDLNPSPVATDNIVSAGGYDIFIGKYNLDGEYLCAFPIGGSGDDFGNSIVSSSTNTFYLTGIIRGSNVDFDPTASTFNLSSTGGDDFFLSKYTWPDNAPLTGTLTGETICNGEQARLSFHSDLGTAPFSIMYNNGLQNVLVNNVQSDVPFDVAPNPTSTTVYKLVSIRDAARCSESSAVTGISATIVVNSCASVIPSFTAPDTVCVNTPVNITNTSTNASSYYWNFCVADVNTPPTGTNLGNPGNYLSQPVFCDIEEDNGNYYGFVVNHVPGGITRLDFGNSLLNTPTAVFLGNISGVMNTGYGSEGIQIVKNNGNWYGILVGGSPSSGSTPKLITIYFGASLSNPSPTAVSWGNIGNMLQPIDLHVFQENGKWYGLTVNAENNTITRFNFGNDFNNAPLGVNLGNIGGLSYPTGVFALNDNGNWYVFVCNGGASSITRLDFGNSLLNTPTGVNLGNPNNVLSTPRDITILKYCGQMIGFVNNATNGLVRLNFSSVTSPPTGTDLGNLGNLNFPHSLSKLFRAGNDIYSLITNVNNNTITRLKFTGCTNSSIPNSTAQNPPPITYGIPGTYNINLSVDDGLPTQAATCKQVVVLPPPAHSQTQNISLCVGSSTKIGSPVNSANYNWNTGESSDSIFVSSPGIYWVESNRHGCSVRDSFIVEVNSGPNVQIFNSDTTIIAGDLVQLNSKSSSGNYNWTPSLGLNCSNCSNPIASPLTSTTFLLTSINSCGTTLDSVRINVVSRATSECSGFQVSIGNSAYERAFAVVPSLNDDFFTAGITNQSGNDDIVVSKMDLAGNILWSKKFGGSGSESVRNAAPTSDGGVLVVGQTKSFANPNGEILCLKLDNSGTLIWSKKFGVGSPNGDLGMDIIETTDGGYAVSGILNVFGGVADGVVIKLDNAANVIWSKRFNRSDGEDGVGIVQKGDTLVIATDLQNGTGQYSVAITKLLLVDGSFTSAKELKPANRGLFNPYLYKNPAQPGYVISAHTIDGTSYANMNHTIITIDDNLDLVNTKLISANPATDDFFTSIVPLSDGSFIGCATPQSNADGYIYRVNSNNSIAYSKRFNASTDRRLYRLTSTGQNILAVGGAIVNGTEEMFISNLNKDGTLGPNCNLENATINIQQPSYSTQSFTWPSITDVAFSNTSVALTQSTIGLTKTDLCPKPQMDFSFQQNMCAPKSVQFTSDLSAAQFYQWDFGNGQTNTNSSEPAVNYSDFGTYIIKLKVQYGSGCTDSLMKPLTIDTSFDKNIVVNADTTVCLGDSILLKTGNSILNYCWKASQGTPPTFLNEYVKPVNPTTYTLTSQIGLTNLVMNSDFSGGNSGFNSDYNFIVSNTAEEQYWVGRNASLWNSTFSDCGDHTSGNGNMMIVNSAKKSAAKVWSQTISVQPHTNYTFSAWTTSLAAGTPTDIQLMINDVSFSKSITVSTPCQWDHVFSSWNSGNNTTATIAIISKNAVAAGNGFALDDIFFGEAVTKIDSFAVNVKGLCDSVKIIGESKICSPVDTVIYSIYKSPNCTQPYNFQFDNAFATMINQTPTTIKLVFRQNGITKIKVNYTNDCKFVADSLEVAVQFTPDKINLGPDVVGCRDTSLLLSAEPGFVSYQWQDGTTTPQLLVNSPGIYNVIAQNFCGDQFKDTIRLIKVSPLPFTVAPLTAAVCEGDSIELKASGGTSYAWSPAANFNHPDAASVKALVDVSQNFFVSITDSVCFRDTVVTVPVSALPGAEITVLKSNDVNCGNDSALLIANGGQFYTWTPNLYITRSNNGRITVKPPKTTTYYVQSKNAEGCWGKDSVTVYFFKTGDQKLYMPNAFTPNGDGLNDIFRPTFIGPAAHYDFKIYNRWGQLIFRTSTPGVGWDGRFNGVIQRSDVYVFYLTAEGDCNGKFEQKGTFVLIR